LAGNGGVEAGSTIPLSCLTTIVFIVVCIRKHAQRNCSGQVNLYPS